VRIIAGTFGGRRLRAPAGAATRPTSDRVREAVFSMLGPAPGGTHVLDLFAGSGAMGLEALSRGAVGATFVDSGRPALVALRDNVAALGVGAAAQVVASDALAFCRRLPTQPPPAPWRWVFVDPPYRAGLYDDVLAALAAAPGALADDAVVVVEHDRRAPPLDRHGSLLRTDARRYGDTVIARYRPSTDAPPP
jgi:16S rRNA (guanine966-N2)-methyltransferase